MAGELLTVDQALDLIRDYAQPLAPIGVPLGDSLGCRLAATAASDVDSPPHDKAMMDGYAVVSGDPAAQRRVIEEVLAGAVPTLNVTCGETTRIMTGAPLPPGADAVVPVEQSELVDAQTVRLPLPGPPRGKHVMPRGEAFAKGDLVAERGSKITPAVLALLAETGHAEVTITPCPRVAVLATGDELVDAAQLPGVGQIRNSNGPMLRALVREAGGEGITLGAARDNETSLRQHLLEGHEADLLLVSGGVSAGKRDLAPGVLVELGARQVFHKVAVKPGKPIWFGAWPHVTGGATLVFGLPGNPVSAFVCFHLFVRPLLSALAGGRFVGLPHVIAELTQTLGPQRDREAYVPAVATCEVGGLWRVMPTIWRGSADLLGLAIANCLLRVPAEAAGLAAGERVTTLLLPPFWGFDVQNC